MNTNSRRKFGEKQDIFVYLPTDCLIDAREGEELQWRNQTF